ncbi:hypothetical protein Bbelb_289920 [Branchiostoma belcheri]|nr:hypothetical protein Bbelb_289920 [Branchiostoma belcheri]
MSRDLGKEWKRLGRELGLEQETLGRIQEDYRRSEQDTQRAFQVLKLWYTKSNKGPLQFLPQLEEALNAMRKRSQADDIGDLNENWSAHDWKKEDKEKWKPVGPMFSIKCEEMEGPVDILLPHVLHLSENEASAINTEDFKVVHIVEGTAELLSTTEVTTNHVITRFKKGSVFGPIMRLSGLGNDYPINGLCVVFVPVNLNPEFQLRVYMMSNAKHIVEELKTTEKEQGYKKLDQEPCVLQTGKNYTMDVTVQEENGNVPIHAEPKQGLTFHNTFEKGIYYKKFRAQVKVSRPKVTLEIHLKDAENATDSVCIFKTEAFNIAQDEEKTHNPHSGASQKDVTNIHAQIVRPPEQTWHSGHYNRDNTTEESDSTQTIAAELLEKVPETSSAGAERPVILLINGEYGTSNGGISTINCEAGQTLKGKAVVYATVLQLNVTKQDREAADRDEVKLITPCQKEGDKREPSIDWLTFDCQSRYPKSELPPHVDIIVGHADITDTAARNIQYEYYKEADLIMFTHVLPEDTEYFKGGHKAINASEKEDAMLSQVHNAKAAFSVGERIYKHFQNKYRGDKKPREHHLFLPRPSNIFEEATIQPDSSDGKKVVLSIGRVTNVENLKGYNLTARAIGIVRKYLEALQWITRGISKDDWKESLKILEANLNSGDLNPTLRPYGTQEDIRNDMMTAHLVLMPSRSEPFGLVGLEAIAAGIPVLISDKSGLADMIKKFVAEEKLPRGLLNRIVETSVRDCDMDKTAERWANEIRKTLTDTDTAFNQAKEFKTELLKSRYWEDSEREFLQACGIIGYVCYVFSENVEKEWRLHTSLARHSHGCTNCKSVVCAPSLAVSGCVHPIAEQKASIADQEASIADQKASIADQKATISDHKASIDDQKASIADQKASIDEQQASIADQKASIADQQASIADQKASIADQASIAEQKASIADQKASIADQKASIADQKASIADQKASIAEQQASIAEQKASIADQQASIADQKASIADQKASIADQKASIADQKASIADQKASIADQKASIADQQASIADHKASIADQKASIADQKASIADQKASIADQKASTADQKASIADLSPRLKNVEVTQDSH